MNKIKLNIQKFASGSFYLNKGTGDASWKSLQGRIDWTSVSNGSVENTSTVTTKLYGRTWTGGTSGRNWSGSVKVGSNSTHSFTKMDSSWTNKEIAADYVLFQTYTDTIKHNDDGTCSVTINGVLNGCTSTSLEGVTSSGSKTVTLDTIPRASEISFTNTAGTPITSATVGDTVRVKIDRKNSSFYETLNVIFMGLDGMNVISSGGWSADTYNTYYDIPITNDTFNEYLKGGNSCSLSVSGTTKTSAGATVLDTNNISLTINIPSTMVPSLTVNNLYECGNIVPADWGVFVKGKSKIGIPFSATGIYGSTIKHVYMTNSNFPGEQYVSYSTSGKFEIDAQHSSGTLTIGAVDNRNKTKTITKNYTAVDYTKPVITTYSAQKVDENLTPSETGKYVLFEIDGTIASCSGKNQKKRFIGFKSGSMINWIQITAEGATVLMDQPIDPNQQNTIYFKIEDSLGESDTATVLLDSAFNLINFNETLTGIGIGKKSSAAADEEKFEIAIPFQGIKGAYSYEPGNVRTQTISDSLVIKKALKDQDGTPTYKGIVLEYCGWQGWGGQFYMPDNGQEGCYYNGWADGVYGTWQKIITKNDLLDMVYPVGSIYMSAENNSPQNFLGGTWTPLYDRMLVGAGNSYPVNSTGGSKDAIVVSHSHTASIASSGAHYHTGKGMTSTTTTTSGAMMLSYAKYGSTRNIRIPLSGSDGAHTHTPTIDSTGVSATNANMPPYLGVYMWKRTA